MDPSPLMRLATSYWDSQVFLTANRIGLFATLAPKALDVDETAAALGTHPRPTRLMLKACVGLGLLEEAAGRFAPTPVARTFLVPGGPAFLGNAIRYSDDLYSTWGHLERALRENRPPLAPASYLGDDPERTRHFVYGMHNRALGIGRALVDVADLGGRKKLLDIGGGPGTYSALLAQRHPELRSRVLELPEIAAHAKEILASMGAAERVSVMPGDYHTTPFPGGNDAVLISGVLHRETPETCRGLIARARESLEPGGTLLLADVFTDAGGAQPVFAAMFGLNMMLTAADGGVHSHADVASWMREAGFAKVDVRPLPPPLPHVLVAGVRA